MKRVVCMLLTAALTLCAFGCGVIRMVTKYADADKYTAGGFTFEADQVQSIELDWAAGDVTLKNGTGTCAVSESGDGSLVASEKLHWWLDGTTLRIRYCESGYRHLIRSSYKHLTLEVPDSVELHIDIASGRVQSDARLSLAKLEIDTASGGVHLKEVSAHEAEIDSASGGITIERVSAQKTEIDVASGGVTLGVGDCKTIAIDSASGSIALKLLDAQKGATVRVSQLSGSFECSLPMTKDGKTYRIGDGAVDIRIEAASGSVTVE